MSTFTTAQSQIEAIYIGYYGRAADPTGMEYWLSQYNSGMSLAAIAASFSVQTESTSKYPFLAHPLVDDANHDNAAAFINSVFEDLFNRPENSSNDPTGFAYWLGRVVAAASNPQAIGQIVEDIISGATGSDDTTLQAKVTVGDYFTNAIGATSETFGGAAAAEATLLVTETTSSNVSTQEAAAAAWIANEGNVVSQTFTLTTGIDAPGTGAFINGEPTGNNILIYGTYNGAGATYSPGDVVAPIPPVGGGSGNVLDLADLGTNGTGNVNNSNATVSNVQTVNLSSSEGVALDATSGNFIGLTQLNVNSASVDTSDINVLATTNVNVTDNGDDDDFYINGGNNIAVTETGYDMSVYVGEDDFTDTYTPPTGTVTVNISAEYDSVYVYGGTNVVVNATGNTYDGDIEIGDGPGYNPTGTVTINDSGYGYNDVYVLGGTGSGSTAGTAAVYINATTAYGDYIVVGSDSVAADEPTGTVYVTNMAATAYDNILNTDAKDVYVYGGTNVTVTSNAGAVVIGDDTGTPFAGEDPSGNVNVTSTNTSPGFYHDSVDVYGGANVTVSALAGSITVGDGSAASDPTGSVSITESGVNTGYHYGNEIWVDGAPGGVTIATTGAGGSIYVGEDVGVQGAVSITDTYSGQYHDDIYVYGGSTVTITENATEYSDKGVNTVGYGSAGAAYTTTADLAFDPTGNVVIDNSTTYTSGDNAGDTTYGGGGFAIYTNGSASVSVTGGYDNTDYITDAQSQIVGGTSTLASISLTGIEGSTVDIVANALSTLSLTDFTDDVTIDNTAASTGLTINASDVDLSLTYENIAALAGLTLNASDASIDLYIDTTAAVTGLALNLSNGTDIYVDDEHSTVGGTVTVNVTNSSSNTLYLNLPVATGLVIANAGGLAVETDGSTAGIKTITTSGAGYLNLDVASAALTTITVGNSGYVDLYDVVMLGDTALTAINAGSSTGGLEVTLNGDKTSFTGGSGGTTVTLVDVTGLAHVISATGSGNEVILTNIAGDYTGFLGGPIHSSTDITGFQYLGFDGAVDTAPGTSGIYNVSSFTGVDINGSFAALDLIAASAGETLSFYGDTTGTTTWTEAAAGALTVNLTDDITVTLDVTNVTTITVDNYDDNNLTLIDTATTTAMVVAGYDDLTLTDTGTNITSLTVSGDVYLDITNGSLDGVKTITDSSAGDLTATSLTALTTITDSGSGGLSVFAAAALKTVTDSGSGDLLLGDASDPIGVALTTVNAGSSTGKLVDVNAQTSTSGVTFTGGAGTLDVYGSIASVGVVDNYTSGSGGAEILLGAGGAGTYVAEELVSLSASSTVRDYVTALTDPAADAGTRTIITGFQNYVSGARSEGDVLNTVTSTANYNTGPAAYNDPTVVSNATGEAGITGHADAVYSVSNGVYTMTTPGTDNGANLFNEITDVENLIDTAGANRAGIVQIGSITYLIESDGNANETGNTIFQLNGVTGITGFAPAVWDGVSTSSNQTIATLDGANLAGIAKANGGTAAGATYTDTGYSVDTLTVNMSSAAKVDTYNGLGNFAALEVGGALTQGNVVVTQPGGTGAELLVIAEGNFTLNSLTSGGAVLLAADSGSITVDTVVTPDLTLFIAGVDSVTVGAISDVNLTNIDALHDSATVTLGGDGLGMDPGAISQAGLTILAGGSLIAYASGNGDSFGTYDAAHDHFIGGNATITAGGNSDSFYIDGNATITANGAGDSIWVEGNATITANGAGDSYIYVAGNATITANGDGINDYIYVGGSADITANGNNTNDGYIEAAGGGDIQANGLVDNIYLYDNGEIGATGNGDTIYVYDGTSHLAGQEVSSISSATSSLGNGDTIYVDDGTAHMWVGQNSTITLDSDAFADVHLLGDVTGGDSSSYIQTTINNVGIDSNTLRLHFDTAQTNEQWAGGSSEQSQVNVATATSLAGALDLAASQAAVMDQQFHSGDYTTVTSTPVLQIDAKTGLVDWFQYQGNTYVVEANNTTSADAAHGALGASDIVVELTGLVDVNHVSLYTHT